MNARKVFPSRVEDEWIGKTFLAWMTMTRQGKHHTVRSDLTGLTLLIITTKQSVTFYGKMYGKVQYRTPIPSHVPVKVNTVTCAGKGFVTPNKHDELPHSFYSTTDNNNYQQWSFLWYSLQTRIWVMREYCEEDMWVLCFPHHKCWKSLSNHESKTSDLEGLFWHEWCGKLNNHISDLTVFTLLKNTTRKLG